MRASRVSGGTCPGRVLRGSQSQRFACSIVAGLGLTFEPCRFCSRGINDAGVCKSHGLRIQMQ